MRWIALAAAVALTAAIVWNQYREDGTEQALGAIASEIAARPVSVRCQGFFQELIDVGWAAGTVDVDASRRPADETRLTRGTCAGIERYPDVRTEASFACVRVARPCDRRTSEIAYAVKVLAHESWHLRGVHSEAETECYALQTAALVAERLGAPPGEAHALALWNLLEAYPGLPPRYQTPACVNGGPYDLRPDDPSWP